MKDHRDHSCLQARRALEGVGAEPGRSAHIGDLRRTDAGGARAMGMTSIRYRGVYEDPDTHLPDADHVIDHHRELVPRLLA